MKFEGDIVNNFCSEVGILYLLINKERTHDHEN